MQRILAAVALGMLGMLEVGCSCSDCGPYIDFCADAGGDTGFDQGCSEVLTTVAAQCGVPDAGVINDYLGLDAGADGGLLFLNCVEIFSGGSFNGGACEPGKELCTAPFNDCLTQFQQAPSCQAAFAISCPTATCYWQPP